MTKRSGNVRSGAVLLSIALAACSAGDTVKGPVEATSKVPSKELFARVVAREMAQQQPCLRLSRLPHLVRAEDRHDGAYQALVRHGLLEIREEAGRDWMGRPSKKTQRVYAGTQALVPYLRGSAALPPRVCFGRFADVQVVNFTEPAVDAQGYTLSTAVFTAAVSDAPEWVREPALGALDCEPRGCLLERVPGQVRLVLTADGWQHVDEFARAVRARRASATAGQ